MSNTVYIKTLDIFFAVLELYPSRLIPLNFNYQNQDLISHLCNLMVDTLADVSFLFEIIIVILGCLSFIDLNEQLLSSLRKGYIKPWKFYSIH